LEIKLSILILTVPERKGKMDAIIEDLNFQIGTLPVEFLWLGDNKRRTVGEKRNDLHYIANGTWLQFLDDDDLLHSESIKRELEVIRDNPEKKVICFRGTQNHGGSKDLEFRFDRRTSAVSSVKSDGQGGRFRAMIPNHLCIWRKDAIKEKFQHKNLSEDHRWATEMLKHYTVEDQVIIDDYIYHYEFDKNLSQCRR